MVIDVGCAKWGGDESIPQLIEEYSPLALWGYDPGTKDRTYALKGTTVSEYQAAAWVHGGSVKFTVSGLGGHIGGEKRVRCFDIAHRIREAASIADRVVLKLDCESSEYKLIPHIVANDADLVLAEVRVEWHCECGYGIWNGVHPDVGCHRDFDAWLKRRDEMAATLRCPVREWTL